MLCRGTAARNLEEHAALKTQLQLQVTSAEDVADRLSRQAMAVHAVHPSTSQENIAAAAAQEREEHPLVAVGRLAGQIYELVDPAIPASSHDPTAPMQCMKQLSAALNKVHTQATEMCASPRFTTMARLPSHVDPPTRFAVGAPRRQANALIMAVLRDVQKIVTLLSTSISHYALTVLRMDSAAEAETAAMAGQIRSVCGQVSGQAAQLQQLLNES